MFGLKRPCNNCPFKKGQGGLFGLPPERLEGIRTAPAFQCHKTVDYDVEDDEHPGQGDRPQQCAGLMGVLTREQTPNQIMQVAERLGYFNPSMLVLEDCYPSWDAVLKAHAWEDD